MLISFATGFSTGASVVISQYFGAGENEKVSRAVHTFVVFIVILGLIMTACGIALVPFFIRIVGAPEEVAAEQKIYLTIYLGGLMGLMIYNMGSSIFRAVGNSRLPFIFLVVSAVMNIVLDLVFVICFHWGTAGVAWATIISEAVSAVLVTLSLIRTPGPVRISGRKLCLDWSILLQIIKIGLPSAVQMAVTSFSNVFVQSYINAFGTDVMGGWTAYHKVDQLLLLPLQSLGLTSMTFVGQNIGAHKIRRARRGANSAELLALLVTLILVFPVVMFAPLIVEFFISREETAVIEYGTLFLRTLSPFYLFCTFNQVYGSALRGAGKSQVPMIVMLFSFVFARQVYLYVMKNFISNTILPIAMGYPFGWILCSTLLTISFFTYFSRLMKRNADLPGADGRGQ